jgi:hypothetical protein
MAPGGCRVTFFDDFCRLDGLRDSGVVGGVLVLSHFMTIAFGVGACRG